MQLSQLNSYPSLARQQIKLHESFLLLPAFGGKVVDGNAKGKRPSVRFNQNGELQLDKSSAVDRQNIPIDLFPQSMTKQQNDAHEYEAIGSIDGLHRRNGDGKFNESDDNRK